jgi:hypothetical protein
MKNILFALFLIASYALPAWTYGQQTYKCGNSYSDTPCPGGTPVTGNDARSLAQKSQAESAARSGGKLADGMEKDRLKAEAAAARDGAAKAPVAQVAPRPTQAASAVIGNHAHKKKKKESEYFTAQVPGEGKAKKVAAAKAAKAEKALEKAEKKARKKNA